MKHGVRHNEHILSVSLRTMFILEDPAFRTSYSQLRYCTSHNVGAVQRF